MTQVDPNSLWFQTVDTFSLCRGGGNGPAHPSQLYAIKKYVEPGMSFLDYGCGSATTLEAMHEYWQGQFETGLPLKYLGVDVIPKNVEWCRENFKPVWPGEFKFELNPSLHKINQPDKSWDVVYSRHVVDHIESFEKAMDEHKRVAKKLVIVILWTGLIDSDEHEIKNIVDHRGTAEEKLYPNEYTNNYSKRKVTEYLTSDPEWELLELTEGIGPETGQGSQDTVIVLKRK